MRDSCGSCEHREDFKRKAFLCMDLHMDFQANIQGPYQHGQSNQNQKPGHFSLPFLALMHVTVLSGTSDGGQGCGSLMKVIAGASRKRANIQQLASFHSGFRLASSAWASFALCVLGHAWCWTRAI